jgi:hypothetical protein
MPSKIIPDTSCFILLKKISLSDFRITKDIEIQALKEAKEL